jgi:hypothetical protein
LKFKNESIIIVARYWHFNVDPNIDLDPKTYLYFDLIIYNFVLLFVDLNPKYVYFFANQHSFYILNKYHLILAKYDHFKLKKKTIKIKSGLNVPDPELFFVNTGPGAC